jgi:hypothetical protein
VIRESRAVDVARNHAGQNGVLDELGLADSEERQGADVA